MILIDQDVQILVGLLQVGVFFLVIITSRPDITDLNNINKKIYITSFKFNIISQKCRKFKTYTIQIISNFNS